MGNGVPLYKQSPPYKILLRHSLSPGDVLVLTAAIDCLKRQFPDYKVMVSTSCDAIFENNPNVEQLVNGECAVIEAHYPLINRCNQEPRHFMEGFVFDLAEQLKIPLRLDTNRPSLYLSEAEKVPPDLPTPYVLVNAGTKTDYTCKGAGRQTYQEIVDHFKGRLNFIQVGEKHHLHKPLDNAVNMIGKTTIRELIRLAWHSVAGVGPVSLLHHIYGAFQKPYVCYSGGREPLVWEFYPTATMLNTMGQLPCCVSAGCWKSRVVPLNDGDEKDKSLCSLPVVQSDGEVVPLCLSLLGSDSAIAALETMIASGVIKL